jgi:hypothetical protein
VTLTAPMVIAATGEAGVAGAQGETHRQIVDAQSRI